MEPGPLEGEEVDHEWEAFEGSIAIDKTEKWADLKKLGNSQKSSKKKTIVTPDF